MMTMLPGRVRSAQCIPFGMLGDGSEKVDVKIDRDESLVDGKDPVDCAVNITVDAGATVFVNGLDPSDDPWGFGTGTVTCQF